MTNYIGDFRLGETLDIKFCTVATTGVPTQLAGGPAISAYLGNDVTQLTAGITLSVDFDGVTGLNNVRVVATSGNGYATATNYYLVITTGTVGGASVVGYVVGSFSIEARSAVMPTTAARTLDVSAGGEAGLDWANIGSPTTAQNLSATNIDADQVVASVSGAVGSVTGAVGSVAAGGITATSIATGAIDADAIATDAVTEIQAGLATAVALATVQADTDDIQTRLPAALTAGGNMKTDTLYALGAVWIETGAGAAGTTNYVNGTVVNPNSSMANSRTIANSLNLKNFRVLNASSVTLDQGYSGFSFTGEKWTLALANRLITNSYFEGATVSGLSSGTDYIFIRCVIGNCTLDPGVIRGSGLSGTITVGTAGQFVFDNCYSATAAGTDAIIDFAAAGATTIGMRNHAGGVEVRNMGAGDILALTGNGRLTIAASCTGGSVFVSGTVNLVNNGSGQTIADSSRWNEDQRMANVTLVDTLTTYTGNTPQTGDAFARLGAPAAASVSADILAIDNLVDDLESRVGTPSNLGSGATVAANLVDIEGQTDDIGVAGAGLSAIPTIATVTNLTNLPTIPANWLTAAGLATDAVAEIADGVWDEAIAGHLAAGSTGEALNAAGGAGDPWITPLPGGYIAGQAGFIVGTNLDATVSSRSTVTTAQVNSEVDTALADVNLDHLAGTATGIPAIPAGTYIDQMMDDGTATYDRTTDSLQAIRDRGDAAWDTADVSALALQASVDDLEGRLTAVRAGYLDNLSAGAVATAASIAALNNLSAAQVNAEVVDVLRVDTIPDSYAADGAQPTMAQATLAILQFLTEKSVAGTTVTVNKPDGTSAVMTFTLNNGVTPTSITRAT